jgi:hypothetical protein
MHPEMSQITRKEILTKMQVRYGRAGLEYKSKLLDEVVELFGYHRKAAVRALGSGGEGWAPGALCDWAAQGIRAGEVTGGFEVHLAGGLAALRQAFGGGTAGVGAGYLEIDTVASCGGSLDDRHAWMLDGVDIRTTWVELRGLANRGQAATLEQIRDVEQSLPFALEGLDSDNGGEFINHHLVTYAHQRARPLALSRGRPYRKNDNAHVEQKNYTHVRQRFGYERHDNQAVVPLINALCKGALGQLLNLFLPSLKLEAKRREGSQTKRVYGPAQTPLERVPKREEVGCEKKAQLRALQAQLNPFALRREVDRCLKQIDQTRELKD